MRTNLVASRGQAVASAHQEAERVAADAVTRLPARLLKVKTFLAELALLEATPSCSKCYADLVGRRWDCNEKSSYRLCDTCHTAVGNGDATHEPENTFAQVERKAPLLGAGAASLPLLLDGARCHWAHTEAQAAALAALAGLMNCAGDIKKNGLTKLENRGKFFALGALDVAVTAMNAHVSERAVQAAACTMLGNITMSHSDCDAIRAQVGALGGIQGLMGALDAFPSDKDIVEGVANALDNLMYDASNLCEVVALGGIKRMLEVLGTFADYPAVAYWVIKALNELAGAGPAAQARLAALGVQEGVRAVMAAAEAHATCPQHWKQSIQKSGQGLLDTLN